MRNIITFPLFFYWTFSFGQTFTNCKIYQFAGVDSLNKTLVSEETYNSKGQLTTYDYQAYKESSSTGKSDAKYFNFYKDTLLVRSTSIDENKDSSKTLYYYNAKGQLTTEEHFTFKRRIKKNVDKGWGRPGGCLLTENDYEKKRTWEQTSKINFKYDSKGNKILYDATELHFTTQNKYTWIYDDKNRIIEQRSFADDRLIWTEQFEYFQNGYKFTRTWYDYDGTQQQLKEKSWEYWPQYTFIYKLNDKGQVIEEKVITEKGEQTSNEITLYSSNGKVIRNTTYDSKGQRDITHIYIYE